MSTGIDLLRIRNLLWLAQGGHYKRPPGMASVRLARYTVSHFEMETTGPPLEDSFQGRVQARTTTAPTYLAAIRPLIATGGFETSCECYPNGREVGSCDHVARVAYSALLFLHTPEGLFEESPPSDRKEGERLLALLYEVKFGYMQAVST